MEAWLAKPLLKADKDAEYAHVVEIDLADIKEPIVPLPERPRRRAFTVFCGWRQSGRSVHRFCMTNIGHFRAAGKLLQKNKAELKTRLDGLPPTKMDEAQLREEGFYNIYGVAGVRTEVPGCSLCMGNRTCGF